MKILINRTPKRGPWGGGAKTVNKLWDELTSRGHRVVPCLEPDIDIVFCIDPRPNEFGEGYEDFLNYREVFPATKIIQRVGDLGTHSKPQLTDLVRYSLNNSDYFIFPSKWAKEWIGFTGQNSCVIDNAPMPEFYKNRNTKRTIQSSVKIVTHHWSTNPKKGFGIYKEIEKWAKARGHSFHYIGQLPPGISFENYTKPISAKDLAKVLPEHDIYLTASEEEAGANHVVEALASGLPIVYRNTGGSIVDYCSPYGLEYDSVQSAKDKILEMVKKYEDHKNNVLSYTEHNGEVVDSYCRLIENYED
jgi:glycosyltransferase involved in cell wall biosynthesis